MSITKRPRWGVVEGERLWVGGIILQDGESTTYAALSKTLGYGWLTITDGFAATFWNEKTHRLHRFVEG
jgi:hypothetical protein